MAIIVNITKERTVISVEAAMKNGNSVYTIDINTHEYKRDGRTLKSNPLDRLEKGENVDETLYMVAHLASNNPCYEWAFSYLDKLREDDIRSYELPSECPAGFVAWCNKNNRRLSRDSFSDFQKIVPLAHYAAIIPPAIFDKLTAREISSFTVDEWRKIMSMLKISMKEFEPVVYRIELEGYRGIYFTSWFDYCTNMKKDGYEIDPNRSLFYNVKAYYAVKDELRYKKMLENQTKIKSIENLSTKDLTVIVPVTLGEFTDEGKQQNNCVGYHYHDSICRGDNLVYFIRKADNPSKSYRTCRYSTHRHATVENRIKNNEMQYVAEDAALVKAIDEMITEILGN